MENKKSTFNIYADLSSNLSLSAIIAINSEFVGFPFAAEIVYPCFFSQIF